MTAPAPVIYTHARTAVPADVLARVAAACDAGDTPPAIDADKRTKMQATPVAGQLWERVEESGRCA